MSANRQTDAAPGRAGSTDDDSGLLARYGARIAALALLGAIIGAVVAIVVPAHYRSDVGVQITLLDDDVPAATALADDAAFANSLTVLDRVRGAIPDAPNSVGVTIDEDRSIIRLTASDDSPDEALRLARTWSSTFISERRRAMIADRAEQVDAVEAELSSMVAAIGSARLAADDAEAARLEQRRIDLTEQQAAIESELAALQSGVGAEIVESPERATGRSGVGLVPASLLGLVLGGLLGLAVGVWRDRGRRRLSEEDLWPEDPGHTPIDLVELAAASAEEDAAQDRPLTLQDLAPVADRTDDVDRGADGLGPAVFAETPTRSAPASGADDRFANDGAAVEPAPATLDLTPPVVTIDLARPRPPSRPADWLHDPLRSRGRTRVPTSRRETPDSVRVVDLTETRDASTSGRALVTEVSEPLDAWSDDLSLLPD